MKDLHYCEKCGKVWTPNHKCPRVPKSPKGNTPHELYCHLVEMIGNCDCVGTPEQLFGICKKRYDEAREKQNLNPL